MMIMCCLPMEKGNGLIRQQMARIRFINTYKDVKQYIFNIHYCQYTNYSIQREGDDLLPNKNKII